MPCLHFVGLRPGHLRTNATLFILVFLKVVLQAIACSTIRSGQSCGHGSDLFFLLCGEPTSTSGYRP
ncbi:hypothetical protein PR002_g30662 [Phytophthora rubi]|uniref:Secreted protein n=1 Tax=Phytophthora rubi TaxID=129364 RepID=A0A6A3GQH8_9STRA|nr:hypothetical protein PR002_g30662 [Phytophthora rubi]